MKQSSIFNKTLLIRELPFALAMPALLWAVIFLCVPLLLTIGISIYQPAATSWWNIITLSRFLTFFKLPYLFIVLRTVFFAGSTALLCLLLGYPVAYYLAVVVKRGKALLLFFLTLPFWINYLVQMYAWFFLLEYNGLINTLLLQFGVINEPLSLAYTTPAMIIVLVYCYLPYLVMPLYSALAKLDTRLLEASMDLGATRWETFKRITLPLSLPGIKVGIFLVFIPAFGDFTVPALIGGSRYFTVGSLIVYYFTVIRETALGAALTCLAGIVILLCAGTWRYFLRVKTVNGNHRDCL